ncbi:MAG: hypothetical protein ABTS16_08120, partial [Candidatus Accumulibacter phosphatis]
EGSRQHPKMPLESVNVEVNRFQQHHNGPLRHLVFEGRKECPTRAGRHPLWQYSADGLVALGNGPI